MHIQPTVGGVVLNEHPYVRGIVKNVFILPRKGQYLYTNSTAVIKNK